MTTHVVYGDAHAHPDFDNSRADLIGRLIRDVRPEVVVNIGDNADMASLSSYDKGLRHFQGRSYRKDVDAHLDFEERVWGPVKQAKKRLPFRVFCIGNHEQRIETALSKSPELIDTVSMRDLELNRFYDVVVPYRGYGSPGVVTVDGIDYAHYVVSGASGRALSSTHLGHQLLLKRHQSTTVGHQHIFSFNSQMVAKDKSIHGLCLPCMTDYPVDWAGATTDLWHRGVVIKRNVHEGSYDMEFVSLDRLKKTYGEDDVR